MKKVLSVLLAAAMVMGMSVSSFAKVADVTFGAGDSETTLDVSVEGLKFQSVYHKEGSTYAKYDSATDIKDLKEGDVLYFAIDGEDGNNLKSKADKNWRIKVSNAEFVESAEFFYDKDATVTTEKGLFVKVTLEDDFDAYEEDEVNFYFYIYDREDDKESQKVKVSYDFVDYSYEKVDADDLKWVLTVDGVNGYEYKKGEKAAKATIDFDGVAYTEFKMYAGEKYVLSSEVKYNKDLSKEYDCDVEVITFKLKNVDNLDILFPASKDNKQVVAVVDGELVPVEATYVKDHKFESGKKANGYLVEDAEYLTYAVIDADVEVAVEETETPAEETNKANPETGAADFVGAAVAMAVVSVAAAGALALKK